MKTKDSPNSRRREGEQIKRTVPTATICPRNVRKSGKNNSKKACQNRHDLLTSNLELQQKFRIQKAATTNLIYSCKSLSPLWQITFLKDSKIWCEFFKAKKISLDCTFCQTMRLLLPEPPSPHPPITFSWSIFYRNNFSRTIAQRGCTINAVFH